MNFFRCGSGGGGDLVETVLWTNSSPTSTFANNTTITCSDNFANYDYIGLKFKVSASSTREATTTIWETSEFLTYQGDTTSGSGKNSQACVGNTNDAQTYMFARVFKVVGTNQLTFGWGKQIIANNTSTTSTTNDAIIPVEVIGLKKTSSGETISAGIDLLWTNSAPTSNFASQTVSVSWSDYDYILIVAKRLASESISNATAQPTIRTLVKTSTTSGHAIASYANNGTALCRNFSLASEGIAFQQAIYGSSYSNGYAVPCYIYGINSNTAIV